MPEELWMEVHNVVQEVLIKTIPKKKKCKKSKWLSKEALTEQDGAPSNRWSKMAE